MKDESQFSEYAFWLEENKELLNELSAKDNEFYRKYDYFLYVLDYIYDSLVEGETYNDDYDVIFSVGFSFMFSFLEDTKQIIKAYFDDDVKMFLAAQKDISVIFDAIEFQNELLRMGDEIDPSDMRKLNDFEVSMLEKVKNKQSITSEDANNLDKMSVKIFDKYTSDYFPITAIFSEIADELGYEINK